MDGLDKMKIEQMLANPHECDYRVFLRSFFEYDIPIVCPYKTMLRAFYNKMISKERDRDSGLL